MKNCVYGLSSLCVSFSSSSHWKWMDVWLFKWCWLIYNGWLVTYAVCCLARRQRTPTVSVNTHPHILYVWLMLGNSDRVSASAHLIDWVNNKRMQTSVVHCNADTPSTTRLRLWQSHNLSNGCYNCFFVYHFEDGKSAVCSAVCWRRTRLVYKFDWVLAINLFQFELLTFEHGIWIWYLHFHTWAGINLTSA